MNADKHRNNGNECLIPICHSRESGNPFFPIHGYTNNEYGTSRPPQAD
ncbi:MAG: hypothetical protein PHX21_00835 [bacterium]|nr:hypothetical protein [bacterium]